MKPEIHWKNNLKGVKEVKELNLKGVKEVKELKELRQQSFGVVFKHQDIRLNSFNSLTSLTPISYSSILRNAFGR